MWNSLLSSSSLVDDIFHGLFRPIIRAQVGSLYIIQLHYKFSTQNVIEPKIEARLDKIETTLAEHTALLSQHSKDIAEIKERLDRNNIF